MAQHRDPCSAAREPLLTKLLDGYNLKWGAEDKDAFLGDLMGFRRPVQKAKMFYDEPICRTAQCSTRARLLRCMPLHA